jgi:hypothetical protein
MSTSQQYSAAWNASDLEPYSQKQIHQDVSIALAWSASTKPNVVQNWLFRVRIKVTSVGDSKNIVMKHKLNIVEHRL